MVWDSNKSFNLRPTTSSTCKICNELYSFACGLKLFFSCAQIALAHTSLFSPKALMGVFDNECLLIQPLTMSYCFINHKKIRLVLITFSLKPIN